MKRTASILAGLVMSLPMMAQEARTDTVPAQYPGGAKALSEYISTNMTYPQTAIGNGIEGVVTVEFMVKPDGVLDKFSILRLVDPDLEAEAMRLVKGMPVWTPASVGGKPVESRSSVPVTFSLPEE